MKDIKLDGQHQQGKQLLPFFLSSPFFKTSPGLAPGSGADTWKRKANAKDRKRIERKRSQKLGQKKGANAPLIFEVRLSNFQCSRLHILSYL